MKQSINSVQSRPGMGTREMNYAFTTIVWIFGGGLLGTLLYAVITFDKNLSITQHMITYPEYRMTLTVFVVLHYIIWVACIYQKFRIRMWISIIQSVALLITIVTWIGLVIFLTDQLHFIFVFIFMSSIGVALFLLIFITAHRAPKWILVTGLAALIALSVSMVFYLKDENFYIPEYMAFIVYSTVFTLYFTFHPYYQWDDSLETSIHGVEWPKDTSNASGDSPTDPLLTTASQLNPYRRQEYSLYYFPPLPPLLFPINYEISV